MQLSKLLIATALAAMAVPMLAQADPRYSVTVVGGAGSWATDINRFGQVAGNVDTGSAYRAFFYNGSVTTDLGTLGGSSSWAWRMNDLGQIVGTSSFSGDATGASFLYSSGGMSEIVGPHAMQAYGINNSGVIAGRAWIEGAGDDGFGDYHAFVLNGGVFTDLGTVPGRQYSAAFDINSAGHVVGATGSPNFGPPNRPTNPMMYRDGVMTDLGDGGFQGPWSEATAINDHDVVVGTLGVDFSGGNQLYPTLAFIYEGGTLRTLGGFGPNLVSWAGDINNFGQVVGGGYIDETAQHAFLYENGAMLDLNLLIDPATGWVIEDAAGINDLGQIAGRACKDGACYAVRLDLVSAVPEPASAAMLLAGAGLLGALRAFRRPARRRRG